MNLSSLSTLAQSVLCPFESIDLPAPGVFALDEAATSALKQSIVNAIAAAAGGGVEIYACFDDNDTRSAVTLYAARTGEDPFGNGVPYNRVLIASCPASASADDVLYSSIKDLRWAVKCEISFFRAQDEWENRCE